MRPPPTCRWNTWSRHATASSRPGEGAPALCSPWVWRHPTQRSRLGNSTNVHTFPSYEPLGISLRPLEAEPPTPPTAPPPGSPRCSEGHPDPPTESRSCSQVPPSPGSPDPKACNWKKYKFIVLNSQASKAGSLSGERSSGQLCRQAGLSSGDEASSSSSGSEEGPIPGPQSRYRNWNPKNL